MRQRKAFPIYLFSLGVFFIERAWLPGWGWQLHISLAVIFLLVAWLVEVAKLGNAPLAEPWGKRLLPQLLLVMLFDLWSGGNWGSGVVAWLLILALFAFWRAWLLNNSRYWWYAAIWGGGLYNLYRLLQITLDWLVERSSPLAYHWPDLFSWRLQLEIFGFAFLSLWLIYYVQKKILHS